MISTWAFHIVPCDGLPKSGGATDDTYQAVFDRYLDLGPLLESWGFEGVFFAEHHFGHINLTPSPHLLIAALAQRTTTLRLGTLGEVLPLHDARRFVEECGMLDYLTGGRLEIGIAAGAGDVEAVKAGLKPEEIRPRYYSGADLLAKALAGPNVTHHDEFYDLEDIPIVPRMRQGSPHNVWVTVMQAASAAWCAERGYRLCTAWMPQPAVNALADAYRTAADAAGTPTSSDMLALRRRVFVAPTDAEAQELFDAAIDVIIETAGEQFETTDPAILGFLMDPDDFAIGSPATVAARLIDQCRQGGYGHLIGFTDFRLFTPDDLARSHRLIGEEVGPLLRKA